MKPSLLTAFYQRFTHAIRGLWYGFIHDTSIRHHLYLTSLPTIAVVFLTWPVSSYELLLLGFAYGLILITELQNSALEQALDHLHPERHQHIGRSKDLAAAAVLLAGGLLTLTLAAMLYNHWW